MGDCLKRGLGQSADLGGRGGVGKKEGVVFLRGGGRGGWYPNEHCGCIVSIAAIALNLSVFFY